MERNNSTVYLIPTVLHEAATETIPAYVVDAAKRCQVFYVENERTARRFFKSVWKEMIIDNYEWISIHKVEAEQTRQFIQHLKNGVNIGIVSEAGCPGIADPGQVLIDAAHRHDATVKPLVGPSSILLALMASGLNGQQFMFKGYLPIDQSERARAIHAMEDYARTSDCTMIFIETPYRNNQMIESLLKHCRPDTKLCIAANITAPNEMIRTMTIAQWKINMPRLAKEPAIFLIS